MREPTPESLDPPLQRYVDALVRLWWIPVATTVVIGLVGGMVFGRSATDGYSVTEATLSVVNPTTLASDAEVSISLLPPNLAAEATRAESVEVVPDHGDDVTTSADSDTALGTVRLEVTGPEDEIGGVMDAWITAYRSDRSARLAAQVASLETALLESRALLSGDGADERSLAAIEAGLASVAAVRDSADAGVVLLDRQTDAESDGGIVDYILFGLLGAALGVAVVVIVALRDRVVRTAGELVRIGALPVLGTLDTDGTGSVGAVIGAALDDSGGIVVIAGVDAAAADGARAVADAAVTATTTAGRPVELVDLTSEGTQLSSIEGPALVVVDQLAAHAGVLLSDRVSVALCAAHARSETMAVAVATADVTNAGRPLVGVVITGVDPRERTRILSR